MAPTVLLDCIVWLLPRTLRKSNNYWSELEQNTLLPEEIKSTLLPCTIRCVDFWSDGSKAERAYQRDRTTLIST
jgi:hypothetical protein